MTLNTGTWDTTADNNVVSRGVSGSGGNGILGTNLPSGFDNALRDIMAQIETWRTSMAVTGGFANIYVDSGGKISFTNLGVDDVTITHTPTNTLTFAGANTGYFFDGGQVSPASDGGSKLGDVGKGWSQIYFFSGGIINFDTDLTITHTLNKLTLSGGDLVLAGNRKTVLSTAPGTIVDFTSIPSGVRTITVAFDGVSLDGTNNLLVQIGDSGGLENSGYVSTSAQVVNAGATIGVSSTSGFIVAAAGAAVETSGTLTLVNITGNVWVESHAVRSNATACASGGGTKTLSGTLDRLSIFPTGANNFDGGQVNIIYS